MPHVPRYEKLKELLREKIIEDKLQVGDRFYSQNELMKKYNLSFSTVTRALNDLEHDGYLVREQGRGTFVKALPLDVERDKTVERRVAVFIPWDYRNPAHVNFQRIYTSIEASLPASFQLKLIPYSPDVAELEQFLFTREHFDGILMVYPSDVHLAFVRRLAYAHPTVVLGRAMPEINVSFVYTDNEAGSRKAVTHLIDNGHRTIGMISNALAITDGRERLEGYKHALKDAGIAFDEGLVVYTHPLELNGYSGLIDLMDKNSTRQITAVFAAGDLIALGALAAARSMQLSVPEELSLVGFDDIDEAATLEPPLTTMHVPIVELAQNATQTLINMIERRTPPQQIELPAHLVERATVRPVPVLR